MDLMNGRVVRGIGGNRDQYQPIQSQFFRDAQPQTVANFLVDSQFRDGYVADLDAIQNQAANLTAIRRIQESGLNIWLDAGIRNVHDWQDLQACLPTVKNWIVGLETIASRNSLPQILRELGPEKLVFSIDLKNGKPMAKGEWQSSSVVELVGELIEQGIVRFILLDLADIGRAAGISTSATLQAMREKWPELEITTGGGVRSGEDVQRQRKLGASRVLVASAIYDGVISGRSESM